MNPTVLVALGSNLGDSVAVLQEAMDRLQEFSAEPVRRSSLWTSSPVDCPPDSPGFVNAAASLRPLPGETPESLLHRLQDLEREAGRRPKKVHNEARPLDLDIIAWGDLTMRTDFLVLPHPRAHLRRFVLQPLAEIAPESVLPGTGHSIAELLNAAPPDPGMRRI